MVAFVQASEGIEGTIEVLDGRYPVGDRVL
jgi:hypothetical protein